MKHDELLKVIDGLLHLGPTAQALRSAVELHNPTEWYGEGLVCELCFHLNYESTGQDMDYESFQYPCKTIQAIEKELL